MMMQDLHNYSPSVLYIMKKDDIYATNYTKAWLSVHQTDVHTWNTLYGKVEIQSNI